MIKTHKRLVRLLCLLLVVALMPLQVTASDWPGMEAFQLPEELPAPPFTDVSPHAWYYPYVRVQYALGLMAGTGNDGFSPNGTVPLTQGLTVAVRIYEKYWGIPDASAEYGSPWYAYYVSRAREYGLLPESLEHVSLLRPATRAELSEILSRSLPEIELEPIHQVDSLPDYSPEDLYWNGVITLYRAGVLMGNDDSGTFRPDSNIRRSELAAVLTRMVRPEYRIQPSTIEPIVPDTGMDAFKLPEPLPKLPFVDVASSAWYYSYVQAAYAMELMNGMGDERFAPNGTVQLCQAVAVAVRIYEKYWGIPDTSAEYGRPWYTYYIDRAQEYGILPQAMASSPTRTVSRAEVAEILYRSLPKGEMPAVNQVDTLPDYGPEDPYWASVSALYRAGVLTGDDIYGTFRPNSNIRRSELATILIRLVRPEYRKLFTLTPLPQEVIETIVYGKSGAGRELKAYRYGDGSNVLVAAFAIHGWEDNFDRDGQLLVNTAQDLMEALEHNYDALIKEGDWSVYVLPCLNPDGLYDGWTCDGPGRCTTYRLDSNGNNVYGPGIDLNRSFPYRYQSRSDSRNYNGSAPLQAREAQALAKFVQSVKGSGHNVLIDTHGWYRQTIVSNGENGPVYRAFDRYFPYNRYSSLSGCSGYFASWAAYVVGYDACLFEFPDVSSTRDFENKGYGEDYVNAICWMLQNYD